MIPGDQQLSYCLLRRLLRCLEEQDPHSKKKQRRQNETKKAGSSVYNEELPDLLSRHKACAEKHAGIAQGQPHD